MELKVFKDIPPFCYLTDSEVLELLDESVALEFQEGDVIMSRENAGSTYLYILVSGCAGFYANQDELLGVSNAPSYFGERHSIFEVEVQVTVKAVSRLHCLAVSDFFFKYLIEKNKVFRFALACSLRGKHKVFNDYLDFISMVSSKKFINKIDYAKLTERYKALNPIMHPLCQEEQLDACALNYVLPRLPKKIYSVHEIMIHEDFPEYYQSMVTMIRVESERAEKRFMYHINANKVLLIIRDDKIDLLDFMTKICMYLVEAEKIYLRLKRNPKALARLSEWMLGEEVTEVDIKLPFSNEEMALLQLHFGKDVYPALYHIFAQNKRIIIRYEEKQVRYFPISSEKWIKSVSENIPAMDNPRIHIISSNRHSVINCLSSWLHSHKKLVLNNLTDAEYSSIPSDQALYYAAKRFLTDNPDCVEEKQSYDARFGIKIVSANCMTGVEVNVIELSKISSKVDTHISLSNAKPNDVIINIDYAYGKQAELIMRQLILMFGSQIKSISIFGKCGSFYGRRGDVILPQNVIEYEDDRVLSIPNQSLSKTDFQGDCARFNIMGGSMLTVAGTLLQNKMLLNYYKNLWSVVGLEMEAFYYLKEIHQGMQQQFLSSTIPVNLAYYVSDNPLDSTQNLSTKLSEAEGIPAVYSITRAVINKIVA